MTELRGTLSARTIRYAAIVTMAIGLMCVLRADHWGIRLLGSAIILEAGFAFGLTQGRSLVHIVVTSKSGEDHGS